MEISGLSANFPFLFQGMDRDTTEAKLSQAADRIDIHSPELLTDEEAEIVLSDTIGMIGADSAAALSVHSGLSANRVFALLGM